MIGYLKVMLNMVLSTKNSGRDNPSGHLAHGAAKTVTGIIGRVTQQLYGHENPDSLCAFVAPYLEDEGTAKEIWGKMQILQEYQIRQAPPLYDSIMR